MLSDSLTLLSDVAVDSVEVRRRRGRGCGRQANTLLNLGQLLFQGRDLESNGVNHLVGNRKQRHRFSNVLREKSDSISNDVVESAETLANLFEFKRDATGAVKRI